MISLRVIFRSCAVVKTLSKTSKRPFGLDKPTMILKSLKSLLESCRLTNGYSISVDVVDDSSGDSFVSKMKSALDSYKIPYKIHRLYAKNNGASLKCCYDIASRSHDKIIYFCEDDYLHLPNEIKFVLAAYKGRIIGTNNFCVHPTDYPDRYAKIYPSYIFLSRDCHWRSIAHTTGTIYIPKTIFLKYSELYYRFAEINSGPVGGGENETLNRVYQKVPCLSPIPSLAAHLNDDTLPPFIDWKAEIRKISV